MRIITPEKAKKEIKEIWDKSGIYNRFYNPNKIWEIYHTMGIFLYAKNLPSTGFSTRQRLDMISKEELYSLHKELTKL